MGERGEAAASAIVFKGDDQTDSERDPYVTELNKLSVSAQLVPALKFEFNNLDVLKERLSKPDEYSGIIFSSPRCVQAVEKCDIPLSEWSKRKIFAVGGKTADLIRALNLEPIGEHSGNANNLSEFIVNEYSELQLPLLIPQGNLSLKTLNDNLSRAGFKVESVEVYRTLPNPNLDTLIKEYYRKCSKVDFVILMSPSAVNSCLPLLAQYQELSTIKFISLGPSTASALLTAGIKPAGTAAKPTPLYLVDEISKIIS